VFVTWLLTLSEERRLRVIDTMVLRRKFGPKTYEVTEKWRKVHNEEFNDLNCSPNIFTGDQIQRMNWAII